MMHRVVCRRGGGAHGGALLVSALHTTQRWGSDNGHTDTDTNTSDSTPSNTKAGNTLQAVRDTLGKAWASCKALPDVWALHQDRVLDTRVAQEAARQKAAASTFAAAVAAASSQQTKKSTGASDKTTRLPIWADPEACPRSCLFVPGNNARAMQKIATLQADCFILDLEDSVGQAMKRAAREQIYHFVTETDAAYKQARKYEKEHGSKHMTSNAPEAAAVHRPRLIVRINSPDADMANAMLDLELIALLGPLIEGVAVPKTSVQTYDLIKDYVHPAHRLWAFFESAASLLQARAICASRHYQVAVMGYNDLAAELQLPLSATSNLTAAAASPAASQQGKEAWLPLVQRLPLLNAACEVLRCAYAHHMYAFDGVYNDPTDRVGFAQDVAQCRALGFGGKTLIHPAQIAPTNAAFVPSEAEVQWARRIGAAVAQAQGSVATVDGKMVEELHVRQAARMLARYDSAQVARDTTKAAGDAKKEEGDKAEAGEDKTASKRSRRGPPPSRHTPIP